ncbi:MAG: polyphenol oxidase family protein [Actinomycetota bacterium]
MLTCRISPGAVAVFTDRTGGVSRPPWNSLNLALHVGDVPADVAENRSRLERVLDSRLVWMDQVHGATVRVLHEPATSVGECDAIVLNGGLDDLAPAVLVADCVPLLLADTTGAVRAAVHVGRAGLFARLPERVVADLRTMTGSPLHAVAGPHICGRCYEVSAALAEHARALGAESTTRWGSPGIDLLAGIRRQLDGVPLTRVGTCTHEDGRLYSYRRDGTTGRMAGVAVRDTPSRM